MYLIFAILCNATANLLFKQAALKSTLAGTSLLSLLFVRDGFYAWAGMFSFGLSAVFYLLTLKTFSLSTAYPVIVVSSFLITSLFSFYFFNEHIVWTQGVGIFLMGMGILLVLGFGKIG